MYAADNIRGLGLTWILCDPLDVFPQGFARLVNETVARAKQADVRRQRAAEPTGNDDDCLRDQRLLLIYQNEMTKKGDMI